MNAIERRPYRIDEHGSLQGPLDQPAPLEDLDDPDGFVDFCNSIYAKGFDAGLSRGAEVGEEGPIALRLHAMVEHWGARCTDEMSGCPLCDAWKHFDETGEVLR